jgi:archaetidylinositol phosphate synthase
LHILGRIVARALVSTPITPNQISGLRLLTGIAAAAFFAVGESVWTFWATIVFLISAILDRTDGELARLRQTSSHDGHQFDTLCDALATVLTFVGIGIGQRAGILGSTSIALGLIGGLTVGIIFWLVSRIENAPDGRPTAFQGRGRWDPDDGLLLIAPLAWLNLLPYLLIVTAVGAPLFALWTLIRERRLILGR